MGIMPAKISRALILTILVLLCTEVAVIPALADGGTLQAWRRQGDWDIAVFTDSSPVVVGPVDISVLLLERDTGGPIPDAEILVEILPAGRPAEAVRHAATSQGATNKLFRAAQFENRSPGRFVVNVTIDRSETHAEISFNLVVVTPWSPGMGEWPWILWPTIPIAFYAFHLRQSGRKSPG